MGWIYSILPQNAELPGSIKKEVEKYNVLAI